MKILIDSSGWLHYFLNGPSAEMYAEVLEKNTQVVTPTIVLYEVYKKLKQDFGEQQAIAAVSQLNQTHIVPLSDSLACEAADLAITHKLAMADAIVYATAKAYNAKLVTSDKDFRDLENVSYFSPEED